MLLILTKNVFIFLILVEESLHEKIQKNYFKNVLDSCYKDVLCRIVLSTFIDWTFVDLSIDFSGTPPPLDTVFQGINFLQCSMFKLKCFSAMSYMLLLHMFCCNVLCFPYVIRQPLCFQL